LFDPVTNSFINVGNPPIDPQNPFNLFCSGHAHLADGRVAFFGGGFEYDGSHDHCLIFDPDAPVSNPWTIMDDMPPHTFDPPAFTRPTGRRWYPTATRLADGQILVLSGGLNEFPVPAADTPLLFSSTLASGMQFTTLPSAELLLPWYPMAFQLSQFGSAAGKVGMAGSHYFFAGAGDDDQIPTLKLQTRGTPIWTSVTTSITKGGSACMYRPDKIIKAGGGLIFSQNNACSEITPISNRAFSIDLSEMNPEWAEIAPMNYPRIHFFLVPLPDGKVLAVGGSQTSGANGCNNPAYAAELYDSENPSAGWVVMDSTQEARMYHSVAVLLSDGRVLAAGGQKGGPQHDAEIFSPPYLFDSEGNPAVQPTITAPPVVSHGEAFSISCPQAPPLSVVKVSLIGLGAATHSFDHNTRFMYLPVTGATGTMFHVTAPASGYDAPPGHYMLFMVVDGVPSIAQIIEVRGPQTPAVAPAPHNRDKNRYISFTPNNGGGSVAFRVRKLANPASTGRCTVTGNVCTGAGQGNCAAGQTCISSYPAGNPGGSCWVQTPKQTDSAIASQNNQYTAECGPTPIFRVWTEPVVHVGDCEIIPTTTYEIYANSEGPIENPTPLVIQTAWTPSLNSKLGGDIVGINNLTEWTAPNQFANVNDALAMLAIIAGNAIHPHFTAANVRGTSAGDGGCLNPNVNSADMQMISLSIAGASYGPPSTSQPVDPAACSVCPMGLEGFAGGGGGGTEGFGGGDGFGPEGFTSTPTFGLTVSPYQIDAEDAATVNVYLDAAQVIGAYEVSLDVTGGTTGTVTPEAIAINTAQSDYVFYGHSVYQATNVDTNMAGAVEANGGGALVTNDEYLAHWTFRASNDAYGVFEVRVSDEHSFLLDESGILIGHDASAVAYIRVGVECTSTIHCDDGNQCTSDVCTSGECANTNLSNGTACDDGQYCTLTDTCDGNGLCVGSAAKPCPKGNPVCCEDTDSCHPSGHTCGLE